MAALFAVAVNENRKPDENWMYRKWTAWLIRGAIKYKSSKGKNQICICICFGLAPSTYWLYLTLAGAI